MMRYKVFLIILLAFGIGAVGVSFANQWEPGNIQYVHAAYNTVFKDVVTFGNSTHNITLDGAASSITIRENGDNVIINATGVYHSGDARRVKSLQEWAYDITGNSGTYNGISCGSSGLSVLVRMTYFRAFDDGGGAGQCETAIWNLVLPDDYDAGTNVTLELPWTAQADSGNVVWQAGVRNVSIGNNMGEAEVYVPAQTLAVGAATGFDRNSDIVFEFDGTGWVPGDTLSFVVLRDADNGADTASGDAHIQLFVMKYVSTGNGIPIGDSNLAGN